jgi:hypothetical protein
MCIIHKAYINGWRLTVQLICHGEAVTVARYGKFGSMNFPACTLKRRNNNNNNETYFAIALDNGHVSTDHRNGVGLTRSLRLPLHSHPTPLCSPSLPHICHSQQEGARSAKKLGQWKEMGHRPLWPCTEAHGLWFSPCS